MSHCLSTVTCLPLIGRLRRHPPSRESQNRSLDIPQNMSIPSLRSSVRESQLQRVSKPPNSFIHILDDDSLLTIFYLCRPRPYEGEPNCLIRWDWRDERWWYMPAQVCRRWRRLILGSASYLRLCLVCTPGTPVADMLAHSPPLPLIIDHKVDDHNITAGDEEEIMFALQHRDRVRRISLRVRPVPSLRKIITAINDEFPILEFLSIAAPPNHDADLILPSTFEAPQLRILILIHFPPLFGPPSPIIGFGLSVLSLQWIHPSICPHPNHLLQILSLLPHLESLHRGFHSPVSNHDIETQLLGAPIINHVTLPNLYHFDFSGVSIYLEWKHIFLT